jgi:predicted NBD/HSP70 family sugar kinase
VKLGRNINDIQASNRCLVFDTLLHDVQISRVDLSRKTGLNKATITNIIQDFIARGIAEDVGSINASDGRKVAGVSLMSEKISSIIVRIQTSQLIFCICNLKGEFSNHRTITYNSDTEETDKLKKLVSRNIKDLLDICKEENQKVLGMSLATLGWLFRKDGHYKIKADIAPVLEKIDFKKFLEDCFPDHEVYIEHDAKVSALAEWDYFSKHEKRNPTSMLNIIGDVGFGGGIIIGGKVVSGFNGIAGEVGHMGIDPNKGSLVSKNGRLTYDGLFENYASPLALKNRVIENIPEFPDTVLKKDLTITDIYDAFEKGDDLAEFCVNKMARYLAYGLTGIIFILNPEVIVFGDKMIRSKKFHDKLNEYLEMFLPIELYSEMQIKYSAYQDKGVLLGANIALIKHFIQTKKLLDFLNREFQ